MLTQLNRHQIPGASPPCVAIIGDIVNSKKISAKERFDLHTNFEKSLLQLNHKYESAILSNLTITLGDEFQTLVHTPEVIPDLIWEIEEALSGVEVRIGIGYGVLTTELKDNAIGMDGSAFHLARAAILKAKAKKQLGGLFRGFGETQDSALNGFARILHHQRSHWLSTQRQVVELLRQGFMQVEIAARLKLTKQSVSARVRSSGWDAYQEAERGWRALLSDFDSREGWAR